MSNISISIFTRIIKRIIMLFVLIDNFLTNSAKSFLKTRWKIAGRCQQCGNCCKGIYLTLTPAQIKSPLFTRIAIRWISWLFDFILLKIDYEDYSLVFTCKHLTLAGKCANYAWRPNVCRNYPLIDYFKEPVFLPNCGFKSISPK